MKTIGLIEVCSPDLVAEVETLAHRIWREHYTPFIGHDQVEHMLKEMQSAAAITHQIGHEGYRYYLVTDGQGKRVGYTGILAKDKELFLSKLYIEADHRGHGYARQVIDFIEAQARHEHLPCIALMVNKHNTGSVEAYKKLGFTITGSMMTDVGQGFFMDDYRMEKKVLF